MLGEMLQARKIAFDILSAGYGRSSTGTKLVTRTARLKIWDEPLLMARKLGCP